MLAICLLLIGATWTLWPESEGGAPGPLALTASPRVLFEGGSLPVDKGAAFRCDRPRVTDGDTLHCGAVRVRLAGIDAPELPGHCRRGRVCTLGDPYASKANLEHLVAAGPLSCRQVDTDRYGRVVADCGADGTNLSCAQIKGGFARERYTKLSC